MAFLRSLKIVCGKCGTRPATERLMTNRNEVFGDYCGRCAPGMLRQRAADETLEGEARRGW